MYAILKIREEINTNKGAATMYTLKDIRKEWANTGSGEFVEYVRVNFTKVFNQDVTFIGYERNTI